MIKKIGLALLIVFSIGVPAMAAQEPSGTISGPNGEAALGSSVSFDVNTDGVKGWRYPMVQIDCFQNTLVWSSLIEPDNSVKLGGDASDWQRFGGGADCVARLLVFGTKGGVQYISELDSLSFYADDYSVTDNLLLAKEANQTSASTIRTGPPERVTLSYVEGTYTAVLDKQAKRYADDLWVAQWCYDNDGVAIRAWFQPLLWPDGTAYIGETVGTRCEGYVWRFPSTRDPVSNVVVVG